MGEDPLPVSGGNVPKAPSRGKTQSPLRIARGTSGRSKARWFSKSRPRRAPRQLRPQDKDPTVHGQRGTSPPFPDSIAGPISEPACFRVKKRRSQRSEASTRTLFSPAGRIRRARVTFSRNLAIAGRKAVPRDAFSGMGVERQKQSDVDIFQHSYDLGFFRQSTFALMQFRFTLPNSSTAASQRTNL